MATCKAIQGVVSFELSLNAEEAQCLSNILGWVSGDPEHSRRKLAQGIYEELYKAITVVTAYDDITGNLFFNKTSN